MADDTPLLDTLALMTAASLENTNLEPRELMLVRIAALDVAQLHGDETPADYPAAIAVWKAARVSAAFNFSQLDGAPAEALLLDGPAAELYGGAGVTFDWTLARNARHRIIVAGRLAASNVARAISLSQPSGVDSCSRIESAPGIKDHTKMIDFLHAAKEALTRSLSAELAPHGIRVVGLRPHGIPETASMKEVYELKGRGMTWEQFQGYLASTTHPKRVLKLAEVANVAAFMASDEASGMMGTTVNLTMGSLDD